MDARRVLSLLATTALLVPACSATAERRQSSLPLSSVSSPPESSVRPVQLNALALAAPSVSHPDAPNSAAYRDPLAVARAWVIAAHSSSYVDATPGAWARRTRSLVTGTEAAVERLVRLGGGGSTWQEIVERRCVMTLRELTATELRDVPPGRRARIVDVAATQVLTCGDGTVQLTPVGAELVVRLVAGRWLVAQVTH
jgi:hypothetical protein